MSSLMRAFIYLQLFFFQCLHPPMNGKAFALSLFSSFSLMMRFIISEHSSLKVFS